MYTEGMSRTTATITETPNEHSRVVTALREASESITNLLAKIDDVTESEKMGNQHARSEVLRVLHAAREAAEMALQCSIEQVREDAADFIAGLDIYQKQIGESADPKRMAASSLTSHSEKLVQIASKLSLDESDAGEYSQADFTPPPPKRRSLLGSLKPRKRSKAEKNPIYTTKSYSKQTQDETPPEPSPPVPLEPIEDAVPPEMPLTLDAEADSDALPGFEPLQDIDGVSEEIEPFGYEGTDDVATTLSFEPAEVFHTEEDPRGQDVSVWREKLAEADAKRKEEEAAMEQEQQADEPIPVFMVTQPMQTAMPASTPAAPPVNQPVPQASEDRNFSTPETSETVYAPTGGPAAAPALEQNDAPNQPDSQPGGTAQETLAEVSHDVNTAAIGEDGSMPQADPPSAPLEDAASAQGVEDVPDGSAITEDDVAPPDGDIFTEQDVASGEYTFLPEETALEDETPLEDDDGRDAYDEGTLPSEADPGFEAHSDATSAVLPEEPVVEMPATDEPVLEEPAGDDTLHRNDPTVCGSEMAEQEAEDSEADAASEPDFLTDLDWDDTPPDIDFGIDFGFGETPLDPPAKAASTEAYTPANPGDLKFEQEPEPEPEVQTWSELLPEPGQDTDAAADPSTDATGEPGAGPDGEDAQESSNETALGGDDGLDPTGADETLDSGDLSEAGDTAENVEHLPTADAPPADDDNGFEVLSDEDDDEALSDEDDDEALSDEDDDADHCGPPLEKEEADGRDEHSSADFLLPQSDAPLEDTVWDQAGEDDAGEDEAAQDDAGEDEAAQDDAAGDGAGEDETLGDDTPTASDADPEHDLVLQALLGVGDDHDSLQPGEHESLDLIPDESTDHISNMGELSEPASPKSVFTLANLRLSGPLAKPESGSAELLSAWQSIGGLDMESLENAQNAIARFESDASDPAVMSISDVWAKVAAWGYLAAKRAEEAGISWSINGCHRNSDGPLAWHCDSDIALEMTVMWRYPDGIYACWHVVRRDEKTSESPSSPNLWMSWLPFEGATSEENVLRAITILDSRIGEDDPIPMLQEIEPLLDEAVRSSREWGTVLAHASTSGEQVATSTDADTEEADLYTLILEMLIAESAG